MSVKEKVVALYLANGKYQLSYGVTVMDAVIRAGFTLPQIHRYSWENDVTYSWVNGQWIVRRNVEVITAIKAYRETIDNASDATKAAITGTMSEEVAAQQATATERETAANTTTVTVTDTTKAE